MFSSEGNGLVNLLLGKALAEDGSLVFLFSLLVHPPRLILQSCHLAVLVHDFATQHIYLSLESLVV